jgi:ribosome-associated protein
MIPNLSRKKVFNQKMDSSEINIISKTELKKDSKKIQALGRSIAEMSADEIKKFNFPPNIQHAITEFKAIKSNSAKNRQTQYLGKLLRAIDLTEAYIVMEQLRTNSQKGIQLDHYIEKWRDRLISDKEAITEFISLYSSSENQTIRQLIQNSLKEKASDKPPKSYRQLFQVIKIIINKSQ